MTSETMTVHQALCEVKTADKRIAKAIRDGKFVTYNRASNTKIDGQDIQTYKEGMKSDYQKVTDLIRRTEAIKAALSLSNANTTLSVNGKEMTVAEAIYLYQHGMDSKRSLLMALCSQLSSAAQSVERENGSRLDDRCDRYIKELYGNKDKADPADVRKSSEDFLEKNRYELVDPLGIKALIDKLEDEIDSFTSAVDSALQVSNATTSITISY